MKNLSKLFLTLMLITAVIFTSQAQSLRSKAIKKELKKINRIYKVSPNYKNASAVLRSGAEVRDHRTKRSNGTIRNVKKTYANGRKIKSGTVRTNDNSTVIPPSPPGVPIPYPNRTHDLDEDEEFKDISFLSRNSRAVKNKRRR